MTRDTTLFSHRLTVDQFLSLKKMTHAKTPRIAKNTVSRCSFANFASLRENKLRHYLELPGCYVQANTDNFAKLKTRVMITYDTVSEAVNGLNKRGFEIDFNLEVNCIVCTVGKFNPDGFEIVEVYRFEGNSDPSDEAVVYAIQSITGMKGVLVNGYGISADTMSSEMAKKLSVQRN
jgi:hypothetical protein